MAEPLSITNASPSSAIAQTFLIEDVDVGQNTLPCENAGDVPDQSFAVVGRLGAEGSELIGVQAVSGDTITLVSPLTRPHSRMSDILILQADTYRVYRASNVDGNVPANVSFSQLSDVGVEVDKQQTKFVDGEGSSAYWYKVTQYNSLTEAETSLADAQAMRGGDTTGYATLEDIRSDAGLEAALNIPDATVSMYRRRAQAEIDSKLGNIYITPFNPVPEAITQITQLIAGGWLLVKEYGELDDTSKKAGFSKIKEGRDWLKMITDGVAQIPGATGIPIDRTDDDISGWPNDTTAAADPSMAAGGDVMFKIGESF